jgi:hypothetical protein
MFDDTICWHCGASHTGRSCAEAMQEPIAETELCNNCGQYAPTNEINFAGFCAACQRPVAEKRISIR